MKCRRITNDSPHLEHALISDDCILAAQWYPGRSLPSWTAYCVDPVSVNGKLLCVGRDGDLVADPGDVLVLSTGGYLIVVTAAVFFSCYREVAA